MKTITNTTVSKLAVAFVAIAMMFTLAAPAQAQTAEELQAQIDSLMATINALQAQLGQGAQSVASGVCPYAWTRSLSQGSTGADVMKLQQFLNADVNTRVSVSGPGSVGAETQYYGPATAAAVSNFQVLHRADILSPNGLVNPTGYFGPSSMAKANALCVSAPVVVDDVMDDDANDDDDSDSDGPVTLGGEADLDVFEVDSADDDEVEEGASDAAIAEVTVEFSNGDARITRMDVELVGSGDETDPWDTFESISLWVDGDKVAEKDADSKSDYLGDEDNGILRFSGLDIVGMEEEEINITVAANVQNSVDGTADGEDWNVDIVSVRFVDGDDVTTTDTSTDQIDGGGVSFSITEEGGEDEIIVKTNSDDPDGTTLQVEDDSKSDWYTVFIFDMDTDDSTNDITLNGVPVSVTVSSSTYTTLVDDARLVIDGTTIDSSSSDVAGGGTATGVITFDVDGDVEIEAGDRVEAELQLRFKSLATGNEGVTVTGSMTTANVNAIDAEGADDLGNSPTDQLRGSATGEAHTLRTMGVEVSLDSVSAVVTVGDNALDDYGTYEISIDVTAFEQDVFISTTPGTSISYSLVDGAGSTTVTGTRSVTLSSTGDESGGYFEINEGETETITLTVTYTPGVANTAARLRLNSVVFDADGGSEDQTWTASPATTYRTAVKTMVN